MIQVPTLITFGIYFLILLAVGIYFYRKTTDIEGYLLGGRGLGVWVTAFSAQASDMSGWLLMGLPGAVYLSGLSEAWIAVGIYILSMLAIQAILLAKHGQSIGKRLAKIKIVDVNTNEKLWSSENSEISKTVKRTAKK